MAYVGGGSNSIGMFADFIDEEGVDLIGVEAAGKGVETGEHAAAMAKGMPGTLHGMYSYLLQNPAEGAGSGRRGNINPGGIPGVQNTAPCHIRMRQRICILRIFHGGDRTGRNLP